MTSSDATPAAALLSPVAAPAGLPEAPYRGIEPFRYIDSRIFFGREEETEKLLRSITIYRGVLLFGDSGVGKSSLINAGFIPKALAHDFEPERIRVQPRPRQEIVIERLSLDQESHPPYLPSLFATDSAEAPRWVISARELLHRVRSEPTESRRGRRLLIFDQFEEFVTLFEEAPRGAELREARIAQRAILRVLGVLLRQRSFSVKLLFVFREDYLAKLGKLFSEMPDLRDHFVRLTPLRTDELEKIIHGPFDALPHHFQPELSRSLTDEVAAAFRSRAESGTLNLSEVQIACLRLWQAEEPDKLFKDVGIRGLLEDYLADALSSLRPELLDPAVTLLTQLVTSSGTRNVVSADDLLSRAREDARYSETVLAEALDALENSTRLVARERRRDVTSYEIVSEFLVPWIFVKKREQEHLRKLEDDERRVREEERRVQRRILWVAGSIIALAFVFGVVAYMRWWRVSKEAEITRQVQNAVQAREAAIDAQRIAEQRFISTRDTLRSTRLQAADFNRIANDTISRLRERWTAAQLSATQLQGTLTQTQASLLETQASLTQAQALLGSVRDSAATQLREANAEAANQLAQANARAEEQRLLAEGAARGRGVIADSLRELNQQLSSTREALRDSTRELREQRSRADSLTGEVGRLRRQIQAVRQDTSAAPAP